MMLNNQLKSRVLVVEPDPNATKFIKFNLDGEGYEVATAADGQEALRSVRNQPPNLMVLDVVLPKVGGFEVCRQIRSSHAMSNMAILFLTEKSDEADRLHGLELGADDYMTKPFSVRELVLRVKRLLRVQQFTGINTNEMTFDGLHLDIHRHKTAVEGRPVHLTQTEFKLLSVLAQRRGRVQSRERLLEDVWEYNNILETRTVDTHMRRLRNKLGSARKYLESVRGIGYRFLEA